MGFAVLARATTASAAPNLPSYANVELHRTFFRLRFQWSDQKPPNFDANTAAEFQVQIDPKCFAQPPGGRDDDSSLDSSAHNLPPAAQPYKDVWNYWAPDYDGFKQSVEARCGDLSFFQEAYIQTFYWDFSDAKANFAVGVKHAEVFNNDYKTKGFGNFYYYFDYPLEVPLRPECTDDAGADEGGASVSMQYFVNSCTLWGGSTVFTCPEIIGFPNCNEPDGQTVFWLQRLCADTDVVSFTPGNDLGWQGTSCVDRDGDHLFSVQPHKMYGTRTGDCSDDPAIDPNAASVGVASYDFSTGQCSCTGVNCTPSNQSSCFDNVKNQNEVSVDCGGVCIGTPGYCSAGPGGDGAYCGDSTKGQDANRLYTCIDGIYDAGIDCGAPGCHVSATCVPDYCNGTPPIGTRLYVSDYLGGTIDELDAVSGGKLRTFVVGGGATGLAVSPDHTRIASANLLDGTVSVIALAGGTVVTTAVCQEPEAVTFSDGSHVVVACGANGASAESYSESMGTLTPVDTVVLPFSSSVGIYHFDPASPDVYVLGSTGVTRLLATSGQLTLQASSSYLAGSQHVAVLDSVAGRLLATDSFEKTIHAYDKTTLAHVGALSGWDVAGPRWANGLGLLDNYLYVSNSDTSVFKVDRATGSELANLQVGVAPYELVVDTQARVLWVVSTQQGPHLTKINADTLAPLQTVILGANPESVLLVAP